jgi:hypothetical protein
VDYLNSQLDQPCKIITQKGYEIVELPMKTASLLGQKFVFSGGGYFRLLPEWHLKKLFKSQNYIMTYFHPRDFDVKQPMIPGLSRFRKFKSYYGIASTTRKLNKLLNQDFTSVGLAKHNQLTLVRL